MQCDAPDVSTYLKQVPGDRLDALNRLRQRCLENFPGCEECMEYGMPVYKHNGLGGVAFASQVQYISLYIPTEVLDEFRSALPKNTGKCCIRYRNVKQIDFDVVRKMLAATARSNAKMC